ncbi:MAG TPA: UDP-N-acetylglucosamine 2-epimerase [Gammaproteobacteria bacterium]|nr:UDP-N-acetylglucosamine 2-epimerase [Gammaproteobacteria bacterium]
MTREKLKVCVFTAGRSDYFLLKPLLKKINESSECSLKLVAGSMHFSQEFGNTYQLIKDDGIHIDYKIQSSKKGGDNQEALLSMSDDLAQYSYILPKIKPDICVLLGDRYEVLAFAIACHILRIPIAHIHGGELSYGSFDDASRHAITKLAQIHFPATEEYRRRIIQMGEHPNSVVNVGALAVENSYKTKDLSIAEISRKLKTNLRDQYFLVTMHPETNHPKNDTKNISILVETLQNFPEYDVIWTISNADPNGSCINKFLSNTKGFHLINNLGDIYIPVMKQAKAIIGNSSSGIIEAPIAGIPTVNIGNRQGGRIRCASVFDCPFDSKLISQTIERCLVKNHCPSEHPYGHGNTSILIIKDLINYAFKTSNEFYNLLLSEETI